MTRLLYEKHVPADALLAPLFASMAPDQPQRRGRLARRRLRRPRRTAPGRGTGPPPDSVTEEQRARWVALAGSAAGEAGLPADPPFRSALVSYLESRSSAPATGGTGARLGLGSARAARPPWRSRPSRTRP